MFEIDFSQTRDLKHLTIRPKISLFLDALEKEICSVIESSGVTASGVNNQLEQAIKQIVSEKKQAKIRRLDLNKTTYFDQCVKLGVFLDSKKYEQVTFSLQVIISSFRGSTQLFEAFTVLVVAFFNGTCWDFLNDSYGSLSRSLGISQRGIVGEIRERGTYLEQDLRYPLIGENPDLNLRRGPIHHVVIPPTSAIFVDEDQELSLFYARDSGISIEEIAIYDFCPVPIDSAKIAL